MGSTSLISISGPPIAAISKISSSIESCRHSRTLYSSSGIGSLRHTFKREDIAKPSRLSARSSRKKEHGVVRSQSISSDSFVERSVKGDETDKVHDLIIVGGGIAGLATASAMHKIGVKSLVLEQSSALRATGSAFTVWRNAWRVLDVLGVGDQLRATNEPITGVRLMNQKGDTLNSFELDECPGGPHELRGVERKVLVETIASLLPSGTVRLNARVVSIKRESKASPFEMILSDGSVLRSRVLLGADGVNSVVAKWMGLGETRFVGHMGIRGLAEYPDGHTHGHTISQYCGTGARAGLIPISPRKIYWFFAYSKPNPGPKVTDPKEIKKELLGLLESWPECIKELVEHSSVEGLTRAPFVDRWSLSGTTPVVQNGVTLAGDALHPMTPNLGQGGCCALEDSIVLARTLGSVLSQGGNPDYESITKAMEEYAAERSQRTLPLTIKSYLMGSLMMISFPPFVSLRDTFVLPKIVGPGSYLSHTLYDPGQLPVTQAGKR